MIHEDMTDFAAALPRFGALAGLDLGTKTIGVAVSDGMRGVASPITTIRRTKFTQDAQALLCPRPGVAAAADRDDGGPLVGHGHRQLRRGAFHRGDLKPSSPGPHGCHGGQKGSACHVAAAGDDQDRPALVLVARSNRWQRMLLQ